MGRIEAKGEKKLSGTAWRVWPRMTSTEPWALGRMGWV